MAINFTQNGAEVWTAYPGTVRFTQTGTEVFARFNVAFRTTQVGAEAWIKPGAGYRSSQFGIEAWVTLAVGIPYVPGGRKRNQWKRAKQAAAYGAAHKRRTEVTSRPAAVVIPQPPTSHPTKLLHGLFFRRRLPRRPLKKGQLASFVAAAAGISTPIPYRRIAGQLYARFFVRKRARRPHNIRLIAGLASAPIFGGGVVAGKKGQHLRAFFGRSNFRKRGNRRIRGLSSLRAADGTLMFVVT